LAFGFIFIFLPCLAGLSGCKTVDIESSPIDTTAKGDSATLKVTNHIEQDPGTITLVLFPGNSIDIINANRTKDLGTVGEGASKTFKVPAGSWKLAYAKEAGDLHAMIDESDGAQEWVKCIFAKNGSYTLELATDGNFTVWIPTFATE
jgi:hypothetical protein